MPVYQKYVLSHVPCALCASDGGIFFGIAYQKHDTATSARSRHLYYQIICVFRSCGKSVCFHMFRAHFAFQMAAFCFGLAYQKHDTVTSARQRHLYSQVCFVFAFYARVLKCVLSYVPCALCASDGGILFWNCLSKT